MQVRLLIDAIVQQTTVLIAQLSTAAGIRAPLAHIADQVFIDLAREIERQGVGRKVVADMFGMALRTYQTRVQRLSESASERGRTLWVAVYDHVTGADAVRRQAVLDRFRHDPREDVGAVLNDLVQSGLVSMTGRGEEAVYRATTTAERSIARPDDPVDALADLAWLAIHRARESKLSELCASLPASNEDVRRAVARLVERGVVGTLDDDEDPLLRAESFVIPVEADHGWEAAVYDHFSAVATAIMAKLRASARSSASDVIGGATFSFDLCPGHPLEARVAGLLASTRAGVDALWEEVAAYNRHHPVADQHKNKVTFYFGQNVERPDDLRHENDTEER